MLGGHDALSDFAATLKRLREEQRLTQEALGRRMGYERSSVGHAESGKFPTEDFARLADVALGANGALLGQWRRQDNARIGAGPTERDLHVTDLVAWLADHSDLGFEEAYAAIAREVDAIEREPASLRHARAHARSKVTRADVARLLADYYGPDGVYRVDVAGRQVQLGVFTRPEWLGAVELGGDREHARFVPPSTNGAGLDPVTTQAAVRRLAQAEVNGTVMVNNPLYRLLDVELDGGCDVSFTTVDFAAYALGLDMLEGEAAAAVTGGDMPLRAIHLPDTKAVYDLAGRVSVGGLAAVVAVARRDGDYAIFTQERAGKVVNGAGKLATIPQAFHQPTNEHAREVPLSMTLVRELEEELLGREDLEEPGRAGDALHDQAASAPMQWLRERPGSLRMECTGLCLNGGGGNYVFSCLVVVEDPAWWDRFGHQVEANWEADRVVRHSTRDTAGLRSLILDPRWADIGLFTLLQGLRRLATEGQPDRVAIPNIALQ